MKKLTTKTQLRTKIIYLTKKPYNQIMRPVINDSKQ